MHTCISLQLCHRSTTDAIPWTCATRSPPHQLAVSTDCVCMPLSCTCASTCMAYVLCTSHPDTISLPRVKCDDWTQPIFLPLCHQWVVNLHVSAWYRVHVCRVVSIAEEPSAAPTAPSSLSQQEIHTGWGWGARVILMICTSGHHQYHSLLLAIIVHRFAPEELASATNNYAELVGKGGFGRVYRGVFCHQDVAVKQLDPVLMCSVYYNTCAGYMYTFLHASMHLPL